MSPPPGAATLLQATGLLGDPPFVVAANLLEPVNRFVDDVVSLDPVLGQLIVFSLLLGGIYALVALGLTMVFGVMDVINFAHGSFLAVSMYAVWGLWRYFGIPIWAAIPIAVVAVAILGVVLYQLTISPIIEQPQHNQLVVTFGLLLILENTLTVQFSPDRQSLNLKLGTIGVAGLNFPIGQTIAFGLVLVATTLVWGFLRYTRTGRAVRGTADDRDSARYAGVNINRVYQLTFAIGAALAAIAGAAIALYRHFDPYVGHIYLINAFVIVVLGGLGSFPGALLGGLIIGFIQMFGTFYMPGTSYNVLIFGAFILVLLLKPEGIFGESHA